MKNTDRSYKLFKILRAYGIRPKRELGQNFLADKIAIERIVNSANLNDKDLVVEFGSGVGFLTKMLCKHAGLVVAVELDRALAKISKDLLRDESNVEVVVADARHFSIRRLDKVVASIPYSISTEIVEWLILNRPKSATLVLQSDFVDRLLSGHCKKEYSYIGFVLNAAAKVRRIFDITPKSFKPMPKVKSTVVSICFDKYLETNFLRFMLDLSKFIFTEKNKLLKHSLRLYSTRRGVLIDTEKVPHANKRPVSMPPEELLEAIKTLYGSFNTIASPCNVN